MYHHAFALRSCSLFNSDERALFAQCSDPPILFTTSSFSTLYLARGVICYIRCYSEEFYPFYQHQEFLGKLCYHRDSMRIFVEILQLGEMLGEDTYF